MNQLKWHTQRSEYMDILVVVESILSAESYILLVQTTHRAHLTSHRKTLTCVLLIEFAVSIEQFSIKWLKYHNTIAFSLRRQSQFLC